jgi:hypothetical protein
METAQIYRTWNKRRKNILQKSNDWANSSMQPIKENSRDVHTEKIHYERLLLMDRWQAVNTGEIIAMHCLRQIDRDRWSLCSQKRKKDWENQRLELTYQSSRLTELQRRIYVEKLIKNNWDRRIIETESLETKSLRHARKRDSVKRLQKSTNKWNLHRRFLDKTIETNSWKQNAIQPVHIGNMTERN